MSWESLKRSVHEQFEAQVVKTPEAVAVECGDRQLTYAELNSRANRLAHHLQGLGVETETLVGLCVDRSLDLVVAVLGIWKSGGAFVPLDPNYPQERLMLILDDTAAPLVITQRHLQSSLPAHQGQTVCLEDIATDLANDTDPAPLAGPEHLAYLIYTSGSTGRPKAVMVEHRNLAATLAASGEQFAFQNTDVMPWIASIAFDIALFELLNPLLVGGTSVVLTRQEVLDPHGLVERMKRFTMIHTVPSLMRQIVQTVHEQGLDLSEFDGMRRMFIGGDAVPPDLLALMHDTFRQADIHVLYGPTEAAIICASHPVQRCEAIDRYLIGTPMAQADIRLYDEQGQLVPAGEAGEMYIGGGGVTRGYYRREDLTAEKFVTIDDHRWYRSGDLARRGADGTLEFLGRIDNQVKIRGFRIELGEIESALGRHPHLRDVVVVASEVEPGDKQLVGYLVAEPGCTVTAGEIRSYLQESLPDYMVPTIYVMLDALPLNPNGKVDRKALPAPTRERQGLESTYVAPRNETEQALADAWSEVLGVERVGIHDNFFELGGHSLRATKVIVRLREGFSLDLRMESIFETPTIAELAERLVRVEAQTETPLHDIPDLVPVGRDGELCLSLSQERVWFIRKLAPSNMSYTFQIGFRFRGDLNIAVLERSLSKIIERHEIFRTSFHDDTLDGHPYQVIHDPFAVHLPIVDLQHVPEAEREEEVQRQIKAEISKVFHPSTLPLVRWRLLRVSPDHHVMIHVEDHLVHDGWSFTVFARELIELYDAYLHDREPVLEELPVQFADYAAWQKRWMQSSEAQAQLDYWVSKLADASHVLDVPRDHLRPSLQKFKGRLIRFDLPLDLADRIRQFSRREGVTLFMTLFSTFNTLLYRYTGQEDILIGSGVAGRSVKATENLMGMIVNNIILRTELSGDTTFRELLKRTRSNALEAFSHQDYPFDKIVEKLQPERDLSRNPLFQVCFSFHDSQTPDLIFPNLDVKLIEGVHNESAKFDMNIIVLPRSEQKFGPNATLTEEDGITFLWEYDTALFEAGTMERMIDHYQTLLRSVVQDPARPLAELPILTAPEQQQLQLAWNDTTTDYPREATIAELFEEQAQAQPDAVALVFGDQQMTYRELNERANQLAHFLQKAGIGPEKIVGLLVERSLEMIIGLLGIVKAGGAYLPLDPSYPEDRLAFMVEDGGVSALLTLGHLKDRLPQTSVPIIRLDADWHQIAAESTEPVSSGVTAENLLYVIYTSGSTGRPKGVCILQRGGVRMAKNDFLDITPDDVFLQYASISFDAATFEIWNSLLNGAKLVIFPPHKASLEELARVIREQGVTTLFLTTALFHQIAENHWQDLAGLRKFLAGGDVMSPTVLKNLLQKGLDLRFFHVYGPTESTTYATCCEITEATALEQSVPIGRPISDTEAYVVDRHLQLVPVGIPGELLIGGDGLARGYLNRPELTDEKFIPHLFANRPGAKLYRTGDLVRYLPDGNLEFLGRIDNQVKIRGFRIELGEIEAELGKSEAVFNSIVIAREDNPGDKRLVAYVVLQPGADTTPADLRNHLKATLPDFMVPSAFVLLEALPLTPNGKVDQRLLPVPDASLFATDEEYLAPRTPQEELVAGIFAQVLGLERVGIRESFFDLGGHSLLATQIISRIRHAFGVEVPLHQMFEHPTVEGLVRFIASANERSAAGETVPMVSVPRDQELPLSFAQQRLLFVSQLTPENPVYNVPMVWNLQGALDRDALEKSLSEIVRRHEVLRTTFHEVDERPVQVITPFAPLQVTLCDVSDVPEAEREQAAKTAMQEEICRPFDLQKGPLFRAHLVRQAEAEHLLIVSMHHIVSDGWSVGILIKELAALYEAFTTGASADEAVATLPSLPLQYADFASWQRNYLSGDVLEQQLAHWRKQLGGDVPALELPFDHARPSAPSYNGTIQRFKLAEGVSTGLKALSQRQGATLFMTLLAAFQTLLARTTGQDDFAVGTPIAGRNRSEIESMIGFFVNTLVMRADLSDDPTFEQLLVRVRETALAAYNAQDVPFEKLVEELQPDRESGHSPFFQAMFVLQNIPLEALELPGLTLHPVENHHGTSKFDITLSMKETPEGLAGHIEYSTGLFEEKTISRLLGQFEMLLAGIVEHPEARLSALPLWSDTIDVEADDLDELFA